MKYRIPRIEEFVPGFKYQQHTMTFGHAHLDGKFIPSEEVWQDCIIPEPIPDGTWMTTKDGPNTIHWKHNSIFDNPNKTALFESLLREGKIRVPIADEGEYGSYKTDDTINELTL